VFLLGFAKNERDNIGIDELGELRTVGLNGLNASEKTIADSLEQNALQEVIP
jgi:hypothetical protein